MWRLRNQVHLVACDDGAALLDERAAATPAGWLVISAAAGRYLTLLTAGTHPDQAAADTASWCNTNPVQLSRQLQGVHDDLIRRGLLINEAEQRSPRRQHRWRRR